MSYVVDLDLRERSVLVVGGGRIAQAHTEQLLAAGGRPRILSPDATTGMARLIEEAGLSWDRREFRDDDLDSAWLVLALTDDQALNARICTAADTRGKLVYGDGDGDRGNFGLPAVLRRGSLTVAVEAGMPHLARQVLLELEEDFGPEWAEYSRRLDSLKTTIAAIEDELERQRVIHRVTSPAILGLVRSGDTQEWTSLLEQAASGTLGAAHKPQN